MIRYDTSRYDFWFADCVLPVVWHDVEMGEPCRSHRKIYKCCSCCLYVVILWNTVITLVPPAVALKITLHFVHREVTGFAQFPE